MMIGKPEVGPREARIEFRVTPEEKTSLEQEARMMGRSLGGLIRYLLAKGLRQIEEKDRITTRVTRTLAEEK